MSQGMQDAGGAMPPLQLRGHLYGHPQPTTLHGVHASPIVTAGTQQGAREIQRDSGTNHPPQAEVVFNRAALGTQQGQMNHIATPVRQEGGNLNGYEIQGPPAFYSPAAVSAITGDSIGKLQEEARGYFVDRWVDSEGIFVQMDHLFKGAVDTVIHRAKFLDHEEAWVQPDFVTWLKRLENGQLRGERNVPIPFFLTRIIFQNWIGCANKDASNSFDLENLKTIVHFWRLHNKAIKKKFLDKRNNLNGAVKIVFVNELNEKTLSDPSEDEVRALTLETVTGFASDFESLVWYCAYCRVFRRKNSNMRRDMVTGSPMLKELARRAFRSFLKDIVPTMLNRRTYEKKYLTQGFQDVVSVSDEAWALVVLEGWYPLFFKKGNDNNDSKASFDHIDEETLNRFRNEDPDGRKPWDAELVKELYNVACSVINEYRTEALNKSMEREYETTVRGNIKSKTRKRKRRNMEGGNEIVVAVETGLEIE